MKRLTSIAGVFFVVTIAVAAQLTFSVDDLINVKRVGDPQLSPDGRWIAYTVGVVNKEANRTSTQIYVMSVDGSNKRQITNGTSSSSGPRWSPDGARIAYTNG